MRLLCLLLGVVGVAVCDPARWAGQQQRVRRQQQGGALPRPLPGNRPLRPARPGRPGRRGPAAQPPVQRRGPYRAEQQRVIRPFPQQQQQQARPQPQRSHQRPAESEKIYQSFTNKEEFNTDRSFNTAPSPPRPARPAPVYSPAPANTQHSRFNKAEQQFEAEQLYSDRRQQQEEEEEDSEISESVAAPSQQRDLEAAVAAGAASFGGGEYKEPQRLSFQIHGQGGPNAYRFGYDTGVGYNRQFRYEERDNAGVLHGRYGYYDQAGKLQIVNYSADPHTGFHAEGEHVPKPQY